MKMSRQIFHSSLYCLLILLFAIYSSSLSGQYNTNLGYKAGDAVTSGQKNVMVGERAGEINNGTGNIFIGSQAGQNETGSNLLIISNDTANNTIYGDLQRQRIAIGTDEFPSDTSYRLTVEGKVIAREYKATQTQPWPDYVFNEEYSLRSLDSVRVFILKNNHLPDVPSADFIDINGVELSAMNAILLRKIEELTLYLLTQQDEINSLQHEVSIIRTNSPSVSKRNKKVTQ
jgi:hypothetical protein